MDSDSGQHFLHPDEEAQSTGNESLLSLQSEVVHFLETPKRKPCALAGGHRYLFTKRNEYDVVFWRCEKYFKEKCRGGIATSGNRVIKVTAHVCVPDPSRVDIVKALHVCRRRAREDVDIPISRIVAEEFTPLRDRGLENVPSYLSLKSSLHRERQKHLANRPDPGDFLEVEAIPGTSDSTNDDFGGTGDFSYPGGYDGSQYSSTALQDSTNNSVDSYDNITYDTSYDDPPITAPPPLKRKRLADGSVASNVRNQNSASSGDENLADNYQAFSELVVAQLKSLPPPRAAMLQMKIQELLSQAIVGTEEEEEDSGTEDEPASQDEEVDETSTKPLAEPKSPAAGDRSPSAQVSTQETESTQVETTTTTTLVTRIAQKKTQRQDFVENKENNPVSLDNVYSAFSKCIVSQLKYLPTSLAVKTQNRIQKIISDEIVKFCNTRQPTSQSKTSDTKVEDVQIKEEPLDIVDSMEC